jgi:hypothetical protein
MNERIEELIKQAGPNSEGELHFADRTNIHVIDVKKFAELLIQECADCSYHMGRDSGPITADLIKVRIMSLIGV